MHKRNHLEKRLRKVNNWTPGREGTGVPSCGIGCFAEDGFGLSPADGDSAGEEGEECHDAHHAEAPEGRFAAGDFVVQLQEANQPAVLAGDDGQAEGHRVKCHRGCGRPFSNNCAAACSKKERRDAIFVFASFGPSDGPFPFN